MPQIADQSPLYFPKDCKRRKIPEDEDDLTITQMHGKLRAPFKLSSLALRNYRSTSWRLSKKRLNKFHIFSYKARKKWSQITSNTLRDFKSTLTHIRYFDVKSSSQNKTDRFSAMNYWKKIAIDPLPCSSGINKVSVSSQSNNLRLLSNSMSISSVVCPGDKNE